MKRILFVCTGNTCRSPMAEAILRQKLKWAGIKGIAVSSAGIGAVDGEKMSPNAFLALKQLGITCYSFRSRRLTEKILSRSDLVITMTETQKKSLSRKDCVYTAPEIAGGQEIKDPFGGSQEEYIRVSHELERVCNVLLQKMTEV